MGLQYDLSDNLNLIYRVGIDNYNESNVNFQNRGGVNSNSNDIRLQSGIYETWNNVNTIWDHNFALNGDYDLTEKVGATFNVGFNGRRETFDQSGVSSDGQQAFGVLRHFNFLNQNEIQGSFERNVIGLYGQVEFDYDNILYLTLAGRNDWVSNLAKDNRTLFYPSASLSFVPTTAFTDLKGDALGYLKFRAGYGTSAGFPDQNSDSYPVANRLSLDTQDFQDNTGTNIVSNSTGLTLGNPNLKPEQVSEIELGIESRWWDNRISLDVSVFQRTTTDLIVSQPLDPSSGFFRTNTNVGEIKGEGIEIDLGLNLIRSEDNGFNWNTNINFTANETEVTDLGNDTDLIVYSGFGNLGNAAIEGEPLGVIYGSRVLRDAEGNLVVNAAGDYVQDSQDGVIGDPNPDWVANMINTLSYKNFSLGFQLNYTQGGDIYSSTIATLLGRGLITETLDRENTFILQGVQQSDGRVNDVQINNSDYYFNNILFGPSELQVYDATVIRLQEVSLGYSLPQKFLDKTPFVSLSITLSGQNLWWDAVNTPDGANFDPNVSGTGVGNGFGCDFLNGPSSRRYGLCVKASF